MPKNWSENEVNAAVKDYFDMLRLELIGQDYNKSAHRRALIKRLNGRSDGSVELKHQNISAVLLEMGVPYINGYKPRFNYQRTLLPRVISQYLAAHQELQELFLKDSQAVPDIPTVDNILAILDQPPMWNEFYNKPIEEEPRVYNTTEQNYLELEARNHALGNAGEKFIINFERARLIRAGKEKMADRIEHVSVSEGPSAGFDILSFEENGKDRYIEGKTTKYGKSTPFYMTANELNFCEKNAANYFIYRVFEFRASPRLFTIRGRLGEQYRLTPVQYLVSPH